MDKTEILEHWKEVIDGYQKEKETVKDYCARIGVHPRMYYHYRVAIYGPDKEYQARKKRLLPVVVETPGNTVVKINSVDIAYQNDSISDAELSRIIRLCRDL